MSVVVHRIVVPCERMALVPFPHTIFTPSIPLAVGVLRVRHALARLTVFTPSTPPAVGVLRVRRACSLMQGS